MSDEAKEKAKKLAAARKKLKEFQSRQQNASTTEKNSKVEETLKVDEANSLPSIGNNVPENQLEAKESSVLTSTNINNSPVIARAAETQGLNSQVEVLPSSVVSETETASSSGNLSNVASHVTSSDNSPTLTNHLEHNGESWQNLNTLQVLVNEKAQLSAELNKYRKAYQDKDLELENVRSHLNSYLKKFEEMERQSSKQDHLMQVNGDLQRKLQQMQSEAEENKSLLISLQNQMISLEKQNTEKSHDLEMAQIRIKQLTDESSSSSSDSRVEVLTQTQYMHEQQIRDLQAMVQQLSSDKEEASQQYQNYVQHLNEELSTLRTKYSEQTDDLAALQSREQQFIEHIGTLEKEIQRNLQNQQTKTNGNPEEGENPNVPKEFLEDFVKMKESINDFALEKHEFQLKIKSQDDELIQLRAELQQKFVELEELHTQLEHMQAEQPDTSKLLASMESDKVAASRAVQQNVELKKQLDELELRFVQLTNDKAELMNRLDSEIFNNREMKLNYEKMSEKIHEMEEKYKFKDEEMIRLSHENMELQRTNYILEQQIDRLKHYEVEKYHETYLNYADEESPQTSEENKEFCSQHGHDHEHDHEHEHEHEHEHGHDHESEYKHKYYHDYGHGHSHSHDGHGEHEEHDHSHDHHGHEEHAHDHKDADCSQHNHENGPEHEEDLAREAQEGAKAQTANSHEEEKSLLEVENSEITKNPSHHQHSHAHSHSHSHLHHDHHNHHLKHMDMEALRSGYGHQKTPYLPSTEAVEKLQQRFTHLISQVADLTDEKQHLEHLVIQLQSETEVIGEYIALYQHQRRILKQREYEKTAQTQLLQAERQQLREKITLLNNLVSSLGLEIPNQQNSNIKEHLNAALTESVSIEPPPAQNSQHPDHSQHPNQPTSDSGNASSTPNSGNDLNIKLNSSESQKIIAKIQDIITEIKENTKEIPTIKSNVDHLNCCFGKFEVV